MQVSARDIVDSVDLNKSEVFLPIYESVVNSIISLIKSGRSYGTIDVFIEREDIIDKEPDLFDKKVNPIKSVTIYDNGEGFNDANFKSFIAPFSKLNKSYGCKGVGRFTMLAMFRQIDVVSIYVEDNVWYKRKFSFDADNEIHDDECLPLALDEDHIVQTKVTLTECFNKDLKPLTAKSAEDIAKGIKNHCFIYYLCDEFPTVNVVELIEGKNVSTSVNSYFKLESKDKEKDILVRDETFKLYIMKSPKKSDRKCNYVTFCANSRTVGGKRDLSKTDSLFLYPILENGNSIFLDIYVVSDYLDSHINNTRTSFKIPESNEGFEEDPNTEIAMDEILKKIASEVSELYQDFVKETKRQTVEEAKNYIKTIAPHYRSFLYRQDVLNRMPPHLSEEKKEEFFHREAVQAEKKLNEKIDEFMEQQDVNEESISEMMTYMREKTAYDQDKLTDYVMRRKAVIKLFRKMLDAREDGKYELEALIHNLIFPMGLTNREISYQYHNLWILDERFATYQFIASDKSITSFSKTKSNLEPDLVLINNEKALVDNPISYGAGDAGDVESMVIFEFKRPGQTAHQKKKADKSWEFSDLVDKYFDAFLYGTKKNYRGNFVNISATTPKFGYVILDVIDKQLEEYNLTHGWKRTPFGSYYKINPDLNLHIEAITFQNLLKNVEKRMSPFFDHLFAEKV